MYQLVCSHFVIYLGFLVEIVMNQSAQERPFTVKVLKTFFAIAYICHYKTYSHWSVIEHRTRKQDIELGNYTTQNLENMADLHGES